MIEIIVTSNIMSFHIASAASHSAQIQINVTHRALEAMRKDYLIFAFQLRTHTTYIFRDDGRIICPSTTYKLLFISAKMDIIATHLLLLDIRRVFT